MKDSPKIEDEFRGDNSHLCQSIKALIELSDNGTLSTKLGGHARNLLSASYHRLRPKKRSSASDGVTVNLERLEKAAAALRELVRLKDLKTRIERGDADDLNQLAAMEVEYKIAKPIAWGAARVAINEENVKSDGTAEDGTKDHGK